jgi:predicted nucleotidyltransferase
MTDIEYFRATYGLREEDVLLIPYGSRVYGTHKDNSDHDFIGIVPANRMADTGTEYRWNSLNVHIYNRYDFQNQLLRHKIQTLEAYFLPESQVSTQFKFELDLVKLRCELSEKSSHSFVKAKKKIDKEKDFYVGWKSLFHSMRILIFGTQIASKGKIYDYSAANYLWDEIIQAQQYSWDYFKTRYQPIYNNLATEFRKLAPKE